MLKIKGGNESIETAQVYFNLFKIKVAQKSLPASQIFIEKSY